MDRCTSPIHCSNHGEEEWMHCVLCRTKIQAARSLRRAQTRSVKWPVKPADQCQPIRDLSSCSINDAIGAMVQYLNTSTRYCQKYYNGQSELRKNCYDKLHCHRFHQSDSPVKSTRNPLMDAAVEGMSISVDPGTYSITAGEWGATQTQTHIVKLSSGQSANLDFVF